MSLGFYVKYRGKDENKEVTVRGSLFTVGSNYKNSVVLPITINELKLLELKDDVMLLYHNDRVAAKIRYNGNLYALDDILKLFPKTNVIKLKTDCEVIFSIQDIEISVKVVRIEDIKSKPLSTTFKKKFLTKENIRFIAFTTMITLIFFLITGVSALIYTKNKVTVKQTEVYNDEQLRAISYMAKIESKNISESVDNKDVIQARETVKGEKKKLSQPSVPSGAFISTAPPPDIAKHGGVLAVQEGARSVIIKRERSLFSKLEETLQEPIQNRESKVTSDDSKKSFETAKVEEIHPGPIKKDIKVGLEATEKLIVKERISEPKVVVGKRPEAEIITTLNKYKKGFEFIFIEERKKDSELKGKVVVFFIVDNSGSVTKAEIYETDIKNKEFLNKILMLVKSIKFPSSDKGDTSIKLPLLFFPT